MARPQGPAGAQAIQQAERALRQRATVANQLALREAAAGGRPFSPPPGAPAGRQGADRTTRRAAPRRPLSGEPARTWRATSGAASAQRNLTGAPPRTPQRRQEPPEYEEKPAKRPAEPRQDTAVWSPDGTPEPRAARRGVLGE
ncbi:hypothetical protein [Streptomyces sp. 8K308]|uniref:hypothetical protein n=1 Tax=Streptomyces sp. 8K308 TaxID=2530388 RepID=UPI001A9DC65B|nr:hypothetical protein [Streptomyces sp. 8K308]